MRRRPSMVSCIAFKSWSEGVRGAMERVEQYLNVAKQDAPPLDGILIRGDAQGVCEDRLWTPRLTVAARQCIKHWHAGELNFLESVYSSRERSRERTAQYRGERKSREYVYM